MSEHVHPHPPDEVCDSCCPYPCCADKPCRAVPETFDLRPLEEREVRAHVIDGGVGRFRFVDEDAMTDQPEPLNVRVARALGWTDIQWTAAQGAWGRHPSGKGGSDGRGYQAIPRYGEDAPDGWAWTGPLLSIYGIELLNEGPHMAYRIFPPEVPADEWSEFSATGASYPEAIARLVVKLAEMGKLVRA